MKICIVTYNYPSKYSSSDFVFVKNIVDEFARQGHECVVVCPFNTLHYKHISKRVEQYDVGNNTVTIIRPNYISTSNIKIGSFEPYVFLHRIALRRALRKMSFKPDVVYCHFWEQGIDAYTYAKKKQIPLFVATGECEIFVDNTKGQLKDFCDYVKGVVCVSTKNKEESISRGLTIPDKCRVIPNSIDNNLFKYIDKDECRRNLSFPKDKFIVAFVGWFEDRKGCLRVASAINGIPEKDVYSLFIGSGSEDPMCDNILFKGKVQHDQLPYYLNAADVFVLPTLQEGCCNAVIESLACGLPIISSNLPFNWDVLNKENSIMVDPLSIDEIRTAILEFRDNDERRRNASINSLRTAERLTLSNRAEMIINFMKDKIQQ